MTSYFYCITTIDFTLKGWCEALILEWRYLEMAFKKEDGSDSSVSGMSRSFL